MLTYETPAFRRRFFAKVRIEPRTGCWIWLACTNDRGYGYIGVQGQNRQAHRVSWELAYDQPLHPSQFVCHNCPGGDNPSCVNPTHLWLGDAFANMRDAKRKGRIATGTRQGAYTHPETVKRGSQTARAKLSEEDVAAIRRVYTTGHVRQNTLARLYGVSTHTMNQIVRRQTWRHVP